MPQYELASELNHIMAFQMHEEITLIYFWGVRMFSVIPIHNSHLEDA